LSKAFPGISSEIIPNLVEIGATARKLIKNKQRNKETKKETNKQTNRHKVIYTDIYREREKREIYGRYRT
jgi:hypothetical protein